MRNDRRKQKLNDRIAQKFGAKVAYCRNDNVDFHLTFYEYKKIITAKRCKYTGILLTMNPRSGILISTDVTLDRVDNSKGYVKGNVVACCHAFNEFKSKLENPNSILTFGMVAQALKVMKTLMGGKL